MNTDLDDLFNEMYSALEMETVSKSKSTSSINVNICISCNSNTLKTDFSQGIIVCTSCGVIQEDSLIDESPEWNSGQDDGQKDPSRCGCPVNPLLAKSSLSTMIGKGGGSRFWLLRKIHQQNSMDYDERARYHVFEYISKLTESSNLPNIITHKAKYYYKILNERKLSRGSVRQGLISCCILYACKACKVPRSVKEISIITNVDVVKINSAVKIFCDLMSDIIEQDNCDESTNPDDLISRFCNCINLERTLQFNLIRSVRHYNSLLSNSSLLVGKTPAAITSALVYYSLKKLDLQINKKSLCKNHNISIVTLNKIVNIIEQNSHIFEEQ